MATLDTIKKQVIALLNLASRDSDGIPTYGTTLSDNLYADDEIDRAVQSAVTEIMKAICETDGHPQRSLFITSGATLTHGAVLPDHYGSIGVPRITPYSGATFTISGKVKSVEEISAYRANPDHLYSLKDHNEADGVMPSKLAGFYAIDGQTFYFTGHSAVADIATFTEGSYALLPDTYHPLGIDLAIANLRKDGDSSDIFSSYEQRAIAGLALIRSQGDDQPSQKKTIGARDTGLK